MALAPSRMAQAQARATLRMMDAASPWRMRIAAGTLRAAPDGDVRATATVVTLPAPAARGTTVVEAAPEAVEIVAEPAAVEVAATEPAVEAVQGPPVARAQDAATEDAPPEAEHLPHGALAEASPLAVAAATAEEALPVEALVAEPPEAPAPLAVLAEPAAETLEEAALEPILAMAEAPTPAKPQAKGPVPVTSRKPRVRRG
jgi:hypothetical protein